ncbi:MAG: hypothetical protein LBV51_02020 [Acholeplasmatales bacterium]|jgi:hypothetical protein|nr:hypothetical protein [Acholeplasmatales bacterium]
MKKLLLLLLLPFIAISLFSCKVDTTKLKTVWDLCGYDYYSSSIYPYKLRFVKEKQKDNFSVSFYWKKEDKTPANYDIFNYPENVTNDLYSIHIRSALTIDLDGNQNIVVIHYWGYGTFFNVSTRVKIK